jgi:trimeric autotransporter adhesin
MKNRYHFIFTIAAIICALHAQAQVITTIAGNGIDGYTGDGGPAIDAAFTPAGLTTDSAGNIYFGDIVHSVVRKIDVAGIITTIAGDGIEGFPTDGVQATNSHLAWPIDVAVDGGGNVYISESINNRIRKVSPDGIITTVAGGGVTRDLAHNAIATQVSLWSPDGIVVDSVGSIYFAERFNHCISKVTKDGIISTIAGTGTGGYNGDNVIATDAHLNYPQGIAIDRSGNIYFSDAGNNRIRKINTASIITTIAGIGTWGYNGDNIAATDAQLKAASDIAIDKGGNIYIADPGNQSIRIIDNGGIITTNAGTGVAGFFGDGGQPVDAQLNNPARITVNRFGNLYIADISNGRIRRVRYSLSVKDVAETIPVIDVYPNPNKGHFILNVGTRDMQQARVTIANILGEQVYERVCATGKDKEINLSTAPGLYLLSVYTAGGRCSKRVSIVN